MNRMDSINLYEKRVFSQNGEDGMIEELFARIGTTNRFFVEFGVEGGVECLSRNLAYAHQWSGVLIEGHPLKYIYLQQTYAALPQVATHQAFITRENIASLFAQFRVPAQFDLLSIDLDGIDYWVWHALRSELHKRRTIRQATALMAGATRVEMAPTWKSRRATAAANSRAPLFSCWQGQSRLHFLSRP